MRSMLGRSGNGEVTSWRMQVKCGMRSKSGILSDLITLVRHRTGRAGHVIDALDVGQVGKWRGHIMAHAGEVRHAQQVRDIVRSDNAGTPPDWPGWPCDRCARCWAGREMARSHHGACR